MSEPVVPVIRSSPLVTVTLDGVVALGTMRLSRASTVGRNDRDGCFFTGSSWPRVRWTAAGEGTPPTPLWGRLVVPGHPVVRRRWRKHVRPSSRLVGRLVRAGHRGVQPGAGVPPGAVGGGERDAQAL